MGLCGKILKKSGKNKMNQTKNQEKGKEEKLGRNREGKGTNQKGYFTLPPERQAWKIGKMAPSRTSLCHRPNNFYLSQFV